MAKSLKTSSKIVLIAHNIRSTYNVGSLFRTAEGLGVNKLVLSGYTPYPKEKEDKRLSHLNLKIDKQINKTALNSQKYISWRHIDNLDEEITGLIKHGYLVLGLEQGPDSMNLTEFIPRPKMVLIVGNEVTGLEQDVIRLCDQLIEIPMLGKKESFNVVQATAMALFYLRHIG